MDEFRASQPVHGGYMKAKIKATYKYLFIPILGLATMGNKGCDNKQERLLKMDVEIGSMKTLPLQVEDQQEIRIDQLTKSLFSRVIYDHNHFSIVNPVIEPMTNNNLATKSLAEGQKKKFSDRDSKMLMAYGFSGLEQKGETSLDVQTRAVEVPSCQWEKPQLTLNSDVLGFELVNDVKLGLGYSPSGTHLDQLKGKVSFSNFRLDYGISAVHPLLNRMVASTEAVTNQSKVKVEFDFGQNSPITIDFFYQEALVKVIKDGMTKSLNRLVARLQDQTVDAGKDWNLNVWESRVLLDPTICGADDCVAIRGGSLNHIKIGDRFKIFNMIHTWEGQPCESKLLRSVPDMNLVNEIVVESVGDAVSIGRVQTKGSGINVEPGAMVKLMLLNQPIPTQKKK